MSQPFFRIVGIVVFVLASVAGASETPDWSEGVSVTQARSNPYGLSDSEWASERREGYLHALEYPLDISGVVVPWRPTRDFLDDRSPNPIRHLFQDVFAGFTKIKNTDDLFSRAGLHPYPKSDEEGSRDIPHRGANDPQVRMGVTLFERNGVEAFTLSCAACHSSNLFGKKILGLTNRFPRANEFFILGKQAVRLVPPAVFSTVLSADQSETELYSRLRSRLKFVGAKKPATLGLDTSLSQVAISLSHRAKDVYASLDPTVARAPRPERLKTFVADSKPAVWWNVKYKNRWLSDGSVVSGNPIYTNILWNEIGRGTDLRELEAWFAENPKVIEELTTAVFSTEAPRYTDFFSPERISISRAKRGEELYLKACARCHGTYAKAWSLPEASRLPLVEQLKTTKVTYAEKTKVMNVGTDLQRAQGMRSLEDGLNPLSISTRNQIVIKTQNGYVPPPLVGIWARYPYFHNNSAPNLCAVLTPGGDRPETYWAGEALDRETDYDSECAGYPTGDRVPKKWKTDSEYFYDTKKPGLGNSGHDEKIILKDGVELLSADDKRNLIEFLKTL